MINVGVFFPPQERHPLRSEDRAESRNGLLRIKIDCRLESKLEWFETRGTHQSGPGTKGVHLRRSRHHRGRNKGVFVTENPLS